MEKMVGPNAMRATEELASFLSLAEGQRVLDLGCGTGISSLLLAKKYGVIVYAADLWISPTENYLHFKAHQIEDKIFPIFVGAYHYFGCNGFMLPTLMTFVKKDGQIAVAVPGLKDDFPNGVFPGELQPFWQPGTNFYSPA